jgi:hypothetical protein
LGILFTKCSIVHGLSNARDAGRLVRVAVEMERETVLTLRLKAALAAERRRRDFGLPDLRRACPPTSTRH